MERKVVEEAEGWAWGADIIISRHWFEGLGSVVNSPSQCHSVSFEVKNS